MLSIVSVTASASPSVAAIAVDSSLIRWEVRTARMAPPRNPQAILALLIRTHEALLERPPKAEALLSTPEKGRPAGGGPAAAASVALAPCCLLLERGPPVRPAAAASAALAPFCLLPERGPPVTRLNPAASPPVIPSKHTRPPRPLLRLFKDKQLPAQGAPRWTVVLLRFPPLAGTAHSVVCHRSRHLKAQGGLRSHNHTTNLTSISPHQLIAPT